MASIKPSSRYPSSFDSRSSASSQVSDPSSSSEFRNPSRNQSTLKRFVGKPNSNGKSSDLISVVDNSSSRALVKSKLTEVAAPTKIKQEQNLTSLVKKFMDKRSKPKGHTLVIPADFIAEDLKKTAAASKGSKFSSFQKKLFQKGSSSGTERKALTEVKSNTRTLAMVLRSERELLNQNQDYEAEITELKLIIEGKNREVEKLKDLCLNQREEIKALKSAILFPDVMNSHLQELLEKQGSELNQAKQVIPTLQRQVTSLTGQLQCLAVDLAEVKSDKYAARSYEGHISSPTTPALQEANNSLEYSSGDPTTPGSPDDMFLKDLNPCLTPYTAKYKDFDETMDYNSPIQEGLFGTDTLESGNHSFDSYGGKMFKSSEHWGSGPSLGGTNVRATRRSEENKCTHGKPMHHKLF